MNASDEFRLVLTDAFIDVNGLSVDVRRDVLSLLYVLEEDLVKAIKVSDLDELGPEDLRSRRLLSLLRSTRESIASRYKFARIRHEMGMRETTALAHSTIVDGLNTVFGAAIINPVLTLEEIKALTKNPIILGEPALDWWSGQEEATARRFAREMRLGILQGEDLPDLIKRVRGGPTGRSISIKGADGKQRRIREHAGGFMDISRRQAEDLVRTSVQSVSNDAMRQLYDNNDDILKGLRAITTLDLKTSEICMARTGASWDLQGNPLPESSRQEPFPGYPPWHFKCRTVLGPITYSWEELIERSSGRRLKLLNTVPNSKRAQFDGELPTNAVDTFDDWLKIRGDSFARKKLGPGLFDLWKSGKITLSQLIDQGGSVRSQTQLKNL